MKRAYRERALSRLYADLQSGDFDVREYAIFQLAQMLRRAKDLPASADFPTSEQLSRDLQRIRLSRAEQKQIVAQLLQLASRHADSRASAFWALREVSAEFAFSQALAAIGEQGGEFSGEAIIQACAALRTWLDSEDFDKRLCDELLADRDPSHWLWRWSRAADARIAKRANAVISRARQLQK